MSELNTKENERRRDSTPRKVIIDDNKWTDDVLDHADRDELYHIEKDAWACFSDDGNDYVTKDDLKKHTVEILTKIDTIRKDMSFENYLTYEKFEKFQKNLLDSTLCNLHSEIQSKRDELNDLREQCKKQRQTNHEQLTYLRPTMTPTTQDTPDIPSRQPCNNPEFF